MRVTAGPVAFAIIRDTPQGVGRGPPPPSGCRLARVPAFAFLGDGDVQAPQGFRTRLAAPGEAQLLLDIMLACWSGSVAPNSTAYRETAASIREQLGKGCAIFVLEGDAPVGAGRFMPVPGPPGDDREWVELKRIGILRSHRKLGLGEALVSALEAEARRRNYPGAQIGVRHDQPRLIAFWASLGYVRASDVKMHTVNPLTPPPTTMRKLF